MIESPLIRAIAFIPAQIYRLAVESRLFLYRSGILPARRLDRPVISVGNLTVGGTGKTPCVAFIAGQFRDRGHKVAILSRGYRREGSGILEVSNEERVLAGPIEAGDEPYLLARSCPGVRVIVGPDRYSAAMWISRRAEVDVFILDDGFQHLKLARDLDLVLIDATDPLESSRMVPFGRLREPLSGLARADAVIVTRSDRPFDRAALQREVARYARQGTPLLFASHEMSGFVRLDGQDASTPAVSGPVAAVSGIARPDLFIQDLETRGCRVVLRRDYPDHHRHAPDEFRSLVDQAVAAGARAVVITEKDAANLPPGALDDLPLPVYAARIAFRSDDQAALIDLLIKVERKK
ncbi:MAG: tetraacyldisaccharide 4'-kinase [Blastocatellales bacterium]